MSSIQDIRAQLRAEAGAQSASSRMMFPIAAVIGGCAVVTSIIYVLCLMPAREALQPAPTSLQSAHVPLQPSAALPTFQ
jgi:hypothetical protein